MQWTLITIVLEVDAGTQVDQVLKGDDVPLSGSIVEGRATGLILLVQQVLNTLGGLPLWNK